MVRKQKLPVRWDILAPESLEDIFKTIREDSPTQAKRVKNTLLSLAKSLNDFPEKYSIEPFLADESNNYRSVSKWSYKLVYEVTENEIIVAMLFHGSQNPEIMERLKT